MCLFAYTLLTYFFHVVVKLLFSYIFVCEERVIKRRPLMYLRLDDAFNERWKTGVNWNLPRRTKKP